MIPPSFCHVLEPLGRPTKQTGSAPNWRRMERPLRTPRDRYLRSEPEADEGWLADEDEETVSD